MAGIQFPKFKRGRIMKIGMLENMRDFPRDALKCANESLSDGIISGLTPLVEKEIITFSKGVIKHKGELLLISDLDPIQYNATEVEVSIKLVFGDKTETHDYDTQLINLCIDKNLELTDLQMELGRFKLKKGAYLRSDYQDLYDFTTEYNTINIVNVLYSGYLQPTLSHMVLKYFARAALFHNPQNQLDISFAMLCMNNLRIEREVILHYIWNRLGTDSYPNDISNLEIHKKLVEALEVVKSERTPRKRTLSNKRKIMLD